jgi:hypothetical protein
MNGMKEKRLSADYCHCLRRAFLNGHSRQWQIGYPIGKNDEIPVVMATGEKKYSKSPSCFEICYTPIRQISK